MLLTDLLHGNTQQPEFTDKTLSRKTGAVHNSLHGTLLVFGETIHKGRAAMEREFPEALERMKERLPPHLITVLENQYNNDKNHVSIRPY